MLGGYALPLKKFITPLKIPPILKPTCSGPKGTYYNVKMKQVKQILHRDLPPTSVWGYNGRYPGPTIIARKNERVRVKWVNALPLKHLLPVDKTVAGAGQFAFGSFSGSRPEKLRCELL